MDQKWIGMLDQKIGQLRQELADLVIRLVNIKSVQEAPLPGAPFGEGPRLVLDEMLKLGRDSGFFCTDYGTGVISVAMRDAKPDLGIWLHGDVVPAGNGWNFDPFRGVEYKGCIIGRGATDNKGQIAAAFLVLRSLQELGIPLNYNPALYIGSNEETGMADLVGIPDNPDAKGFLNVATPPRLSLVPDGGFSVGYGGKGAVVLKLRSNTPLHNCTLSAGQPETPGLATAIFRQPLPIAEIPRCSVNENTLSAWTPPRHGASPDPNGNMITVLSDAVLSCGLSHEADRYIWEFLQEVSSHIYGETLEIATRSQEMSPLTVFAQSVETVAGCCEVTLNIRYPSEISAAEIVTRTETAAAKRNFSLSYRKIGTPAFLAPKDTPVVRVLCSASDEVIGNKIPPFTMSGGTYAHRLPNAYIFGMSGNQPPADFPEGRGEAHGVDEAVSLDRLEWAMRIYARALIRLNETPW